ncbi:MAG: hypothetical protein GX883_06665 [Firmicutes bacterium]|nr:hypothetical protein [Bacillota bacterium]
MDRRHMLRTLIFTLAFLALFLCPGWMVNALAAKEADAVEFVENGGFETGDFTGWMVTGGDFPEVQGSVVSTGLHAAHMGDGAEGLWFGGGQGSATIEQEVTLPAGVENAVLTLDYLVDDTDEDEGWDGMQVFIDNQEILYVWEETDGWETFTYDLTAYVGKSFVLAVTAWTADEDVEINYYVDNISVSANGWTVSKRANPEELTLRRGESAVIEYTIVTENYGELPAGLEDSFLMLGSSAVNWADAENDTISLSGFTFVREPGYSGLLAAQDTVAGGTYSYKVTVTNVSAEEGASYVLFNSAALIFRGEPLREDSVRVTIYVPSASEEEEEEEEEKEKDPGPQKEEEGEKEGELPKTSGGLSLATLAIITLASGVATATVRRRHR